MNRWYLGLPLAGVLLFGVVYWQFKQRYEVAEVAAAAAAEAAQIEERQRLEESRRAAIEQQRQLIEQRRLAREEEKQREEAAARLREQLETERASVLGVANADRRAIIVLEQKLSFEQELLQRVQGTRDRLVGEKTFLDDYVPVAVENQQRMLDLLKDYRAAEEARDELRREALLSDAERAAR